MVCINELKETIGLTDVDSSLNLGSTDCPACGKKNKATVYANQHIKCWSSNCVLNTRHDLISYYAWKNGLSIPQDFSRCIRELAFIAGLDVHYEIQSNFLDEVLKIYEYYLWSPEGEKARDYLYSRGFDEMTLKINRIGYAPTETSLREFDLDINKLKYNNLLNNGREYFSKRIIFPIHSSRGEVVHFTGRYLGDIPLDLDGEPKYPRYKDTKGEVGIKNYLAFEYKIPLFRKDHTLFITEGFPDAMMLDQLGMQSLGMLGLEKLEVHARKITEFKEVVFIFDNDTFESGVNKGVYKSWVKVLPQILTMACLLNKIKFYVWMVPSLVEKSNSIVPCKDINDWVKCYLGNAKKTIEEEKIPLVKYAIDSYIDDPSRHRDLVRVLNNTEDEEYFLTRREELFGGKTLIEYLKEIL